MDPTGKFLFVTSAATNQLTIFRVSRSDGTLRMVPGSPFTISQNAAPQLASTGLYLFVGENGGGAISSYRIDPMSGSPKLVSQTNDNEDYTLLGADPSGHFLLAASQLAESDGNQNRIDTLKISPQNGALMLVSSSRLRGNALPTNIHVGTGAAAVQWSPAKAYIGMAGRSGAGELASYEIDPIRGMLNSTSTVSLAPAPTTIKTLNGAVAVHTLPDA